MKTISKETFNQASICIFYLITIGLKRLRQQLNVRPNSNDPTESAQATKSLAVVYDYVEESPECTQLLKIWEWQHQLDIRRIEASIVEVLSKLIHQCNTALHRPQAMRLTRSILQNQSRMTCIYKNLSSGRQNTVQATLRLLTAMNHVHHTTTKELKDGFNFSLKALSKLRHMRRKEGETESTNKAGILRSTIIRIALPSTGYLGIFSYNVSMALRTDCIFFGNFRYPDTLCPVSVGILHPRRCDSQEGNTGDA